MHRLFAPGGKKVRGGFENVTSIFFLENIFPGVIDDGGFDFMFGEKLPRFEARLSSGPKIKPVNSGHDIIPLIHLLKSNKIPRLKK